MVYRPAERFGKGAPLSTLEIPRREGLMEHPDMQNKMTMFEQTILDLGAELYSLKAVVARTQESHDQFLAIIKGLKQLLDEKGLITLEDFDAAVELGEAIERFNSQHEHAVHQELEKIKKSGH